MGIIAHEIYFGEHPFGKNAKDPIDVYREIVKKEIRFQSVDPGIVLLIKSLLKKKVAERLCSLDQAKLLEIFVDFKWNEMIDLRLAAPFIPKISQNKDFKTYSIKYLSYVKNELEANKKKDESLLSSYDESEDKEINYDQNWADIF